MQGAAGLQGSGSAQASRLACAGRSPLPFHPCSWQELLQNHRARRLLEPRGGKQTGCGAAGEGWAVVVFREAKKHQALYGAPLSLPNVQHTSPYLGQFRDIRLSDKCWSCSASITQPQAQPLPRTPQARAGSALPEPFPHSSPTP